MHSYGPINPPALQSYRQIPIAVVGLACRLPGGCNSPSAFWKFLEDGKVAPIQPPDNRFSLDGHYDGSGRPRTMVSPGAMFIDADPRVVDAGFFGLSHADAVAMDPQQRQLLEVVYEGLESAGIPLTAISGKSFGCFVGSYANDYGDMQSRDPEERVVGSTVGLGRAMLSNRISHFLNIKGTSMTVDTACSGSLVSVDIACRYLHLGEIDGAIVASCNLFLSPEHNTDSMAMAGAATRSGRSHTFDAKADGYIKSEAVNMVLLKRLDDAVAAGDPIRAVIRGTASTSDGWTVGIASPSAEAQTLAIRRAYANAGISDLSLTGYLEAHGTGTKAGDPIEASAISAVFRESRTTKTPLYVGSVKSNIGHSEPASGLSGLLKVILALESGKIPPNPTFVTPSPDIDFEALKLRVPQTLTAWPENALRRASVNSFGYGGSNAHVVVESLNAFSKDVEVRHSGSLRPSGSDVFAKMTMNSRKHILVFSADNENSLQQSIDELRKHLVNPAVAVQLRDLAYTLAARRSHHFYRAYTVVRNGRLSKAQIFRGKKLSNTPRVGLVFTGQGSQWPQMGKDIIKGFETARKMVERLDAALLALPNPPKWTLKEYLVEPKDAVELRDPLFSQPLITALQLCQLAVLRSWNVEYFGVVGHSSGEIAAASAAGYLTPEQAIQVAYLRGLAARRCQICSKCGMLAVGIGADDAQKHLDQFDNRVQIACFNSPKSSTLSGPVIDLESLESKLVEENIFARMLHVDLAYHSQWMTEIGEEYMKLLNNVSLSDSFTPTGIPMFSSVSGAILANACDAEYWKQNMVSPVLFDRAVTQMISYDIDLLLELGPSGALAGPIKQIPKPPQVEYLAVAKRNEDCFELMLRAAGELYLRGGSLNLAEVNSDERNEAFKISADLPTYPWDHSKVYWYESEASKDWRFKKFITHDLLGSKVLGTPWRAPWFRKSLRVQDLPWLRDHVITGNIVFPAAAYICMAIEALHQIKIARRQNIVEAEQQVFAYQLKDIAFKRAMILQDDGIENKISMSMSPCNDIDSLRFHFKVFSLMVDDWQLHCEGFIQLVSVEKQNSQADQHVPELRYTTPGKLWYKAMAESGFCFGPSFQKQLAVECLDGATQNRALLDLNPPPSLHVESAYHLHPTALDGCLQAATSSLYQGRRSEIESVVVPTRIDSLTVYPQASIPDKAIAQASRMYSGTGNRSRPESYILDIRVQDMLTSVALLKLSGLGFGQIDHRIQVADSMTISKEIWKPDLSFLDSSTLNMLTAGQGTTLQGVFELLLHKQPNPRVLEASIPICTSRSVWLDICCGKNMQLRHDNFTLVCQNANNLVDISACYEQQLEMQSIVHNLNDESLPHGIEEASQDMIILNINLDILGSLHNIILNCYRLISNEGFLILLIHEPELTHLETVMLNKQSNEFGNNSFDAVLENTGFSPMVTITRSEKLSASIQFVGLTYAASPRLERILLPQHLVVGCTTDTRLPEMVKQGLEAAGWSTSEQRVDQITGPMAEPIMIFEDCESSFLKDVSEQQWQMLRNLLSSNAKILWVTIGALSGDARLESSLIHGLARTVRAENSDVSLKILDLATGLNARSVACIDKVLKAFSQSNENEYVERNGVLCISRIVPDSSLSLIPNQLFREERFRGSATCHRLQCEHAGLLNTVTYVEDLELSENELAEGFVEVDILAAGVNFKDAAIVMGIVPEDTTSLGLEGAGIIRRLGNNTTPFKIGQRVVTFRKGTFTNRLQVPKKRVHILPGSMSFEEAATMPCVFGVSIYGLFDLANLQIGQTVLITSAAGGVGIAAIQLCRMIGAEVFATCSSTEKRQFLQSEFSIPEDHIFQSRQIGFRDGIMRMTNGKGVDVVLNSLSGDLLDEAWRCIAANGTFIEIGKKDILARHSLSMEPFGRNASFRALDMSHESVSDSLCSRLLHQMMEYAEQGHIKPITPITNFSFGDIVGAIRLIRSGNHIGKIVISDGPDGDATISTKSFLPKLKLGSNVSYMVVGGLKGLCGSLALYLARCGARQLVILARSGYNDEKSQAVLLNLENLGCRVNLVQGDVTKIEDVQRAFNSTTLPIDGIIHGAMVLRDRIFQSMSLEEFHAVLRPKVAGTRNLHEVSQVVGRPLSFFTMLSSLSGIVGQKGQANYAAANVFLDFFAAYRQSQGLPACSVDLGVIEDVGYVAEHQELAAKLDWSPWAVAINEATLHRIISKSILLQQEQLSSANNSVPCQMITGLNFPLPRTSELLADSRFLPLRARAGDADSNTTALAEGDNDEISRNLQALTQLKRSMASKTPHEQVISLLQPVISVVSLRLAQIMALDEEVEPAKPLSSYGLDSLAAVELRNWIRMKLEIEVSALELTEAKTLTDLCKSFVEKKLGLKEQS